MFIDRLVEKVRKRFSIIYSKVGEALILVNPFCVNHATYWNNYLYDIERYLGFSSTIGNADNFENLKARITVCYHIIEKGLTFREILPGADKNLIDVLFNRLELYLKNNYPSGNEQFISAIKVLECYCAVHTSKGHDVRDIEAKVARFRKFSINTNVGGGVKQVLRADVINEAVKDFEHLTNSRHSIRDFDGKNVDRNLILRAVKIAQRSPSVCNRQSWSVYIIEDREIMKHALSLQDGCREFGSLADKILIVTGNLRTFRGINERNQVFVDGGMFGMSLIYALHFLGIGTCALGWMASKERDIKLRILLSISADEVVVFSILIGHLPETIKVTVSQRKAVENAIKIV